MRAEGAVSMILQALHDDSVSSQYFGVLVGTSVNQDGRYVLNAIVTINILILYKEELKIGCSGVIC